MKKTKFKKVLSILLAIMMMASTCTFAISASAADLCPVCGVSEMDAGVACVATCTEDGGMKYSCISDECDYYYIVASGNDPATGHDYEGADSSVVSPTCTEQGYTQYYCNDCGEPNPDPTSYVDALGHTWGETTQITASTCVTAGTGTHTCSVCKVTEEVTLDLADHNYIIFISYTEGTCVDNGYNTYQCYNCTATTDIEVLDSQTTNHVDADGDDLCDNCGQIMEGSFWDELITFFLMLFEIIASWFE